MNRGARCRGDAGGAFVLVLLVGAALAAVLTSALGDLGAAVVDRTRAQAAADAAALAGLTDGAAGALALATRNGASLVSFEENGAASEVTVVVSVDGVRASARASNSP